MRIATWNVNGIRAVAQKGFSNALDLLNADVVCLQETKAQDDQVQDVLQGLPYQLYHNQAEKKGYSGVATLTKLKPSSVAKGINLQQHDQEGRVLVTEFSDFYLVNVYVPNSSRDLVRLPYRETWDNDFASFLNSLLRKKELIVCGDLNVAHQPIDLARPKSNYNKTAGYTQKEIDGLSALLKHTGLVDAYRTLYPDKQEYTWWSYMFNSRAKNIGWRIDYFLVSPEIMKSVRSVEIFAQIEGSDHCPVVLEF